MSLVDIISVVKRKKNQGMTSREFTLRSISVFSIPPLRKYKSKKQGYNLSSSSHIAFDNKTIMTNIYHTTNLFHNMKNHILKLYPLLDTLILGVTFVA